MDRTENEITLDVDKWHAVRMEMLGGYHDGYTEIQLVPPETIGFAMYLQVLQDEMRDYGRVSFENGKLVVRCHSLCR